MAVQQRVHHAEGHADRMLAQDGQELAAVQGGEQQRIASAVLQPRGSR